MFDFTSAAVTKLTYMKADMHTAGKPSPSASTAPFMQTLWSQIDRLQLSFGCFGPQNQELRIPSASFCHIWRTELVNLCSSDTILHVKKHPNRCADQCLLFISADPGPLGALDQSWELNFNTFSVLLLSHLSVLRSESSTFRSIILPLLLKSKWKV